jgi:hypothetical protein
LHHGSFWICDWGNGTATAFGTGLTGLAGFYWDMALDSQVAQEQLHSGFGTLQVGAAAKRELLDGVKNSPYPLDMDFTRSEHPEQLYVFAPFIN